MNRTERFATDPIPVLVRRTCTPPALSMLAQGVDIVDDGLFVAHYGELAYRASTVAYPVQVAVMAVAVGTSIGVNSVLSRALGRHDGRGARVQADGAGLRLLRSGEYACPVLYGHRKWSRAHGCYLSATADRAPSALRADYGHGGGILGVPCLRCG